MENKKRKWSESAEPLETFTLLNILDKKDIIKVLQNILTKHVIDVEPFLPKIKVKTVMEHMNQLFQQLHSSFPFHKNGCVFDDYCFNRVKPQLTLIQVM